MHQGRIRENAEVETGQQEEGPEVILMRRLEREKVHQSCVGFGGDLFFGPRPHVLFFPRTAAVACADIPVIHHSAVCFKTLF